MRRSSTELWAGILCARLEQVRAFLPSSLRGVIQFEIEQPGASAFTFCLEFDGSKSGGRLGPCAEEERISARVRTRADEIERLFSADGAPSSFEIEGDRGLVAAWLDASDAAPKSESFLSVRCSR
jgi:hypothetical protein